MILEDLSDTCRQPSPPWQAPTQMSNYFPSKNLATSTITETKLIIQTIRFLTNSRGLITSTEQRRDWGCSSVGRELA